ncbi:MAG: ATP-binding protein [Methyloligellaceae bacterium]
MQPNIQVTPDTNTQRDIAIGRVVSVSGSQAIIMLDNTRVSSMTAMHNRPDIGAVLRIYTSVATVYGMISGLSIPVPVQNGQAGEEVWIAEVELVGELQENADRTEKEFGRGVSIYPCLGDLAYVATLEDLELVYDTNTDSSISIGHITQAPTIPAMVRVNDLLGKHFAILGTTGTGKSCAVALVLQKILQHNPLGHIVLLDPHDEYSAAFPNNAEIIRPSDLHLPYWFFTFEEIVEVLVGSKAGRETEVEILAELIPMAKMRFSSRENKQQASLRKGGEAVTHSVDSPVPYRVTDLVKLLDERMGKLDHKRDVWAHKQLKYRLEALMQDPRYAFMFGSNTVQDHMSDVLGRIFRIPVNDKPISILHLSGLPSEIVNVVVSVLCRMTFDLGLWSNGAIPITLICEEAHRYIPTDPSLGFEPTRRSIARIAKEGRKYGVSLCIVSQRPSELDQTILSQCNTVFAMRMSNEKDQNIVSAAISDAGAGMLEFLPSLGNREVIAFGDGMPFPARLRLNKLSEDEMPRGCTALFTEKWKQEAGNTEMLTDVVERWRTSGSMYIGSTMNADSVNQRLVDLGPEYRGRGPTTPFPKDKSE